MIKGPPGRFTGLRGGRISYMRVGIMLNNPIGNLRKNLGRPLGRRPRRILIGAIIALCLFSLFQIIAPFLISSTVVRESMERAVAEWTGHDVTIEGTPDIRFWPEPRITLREITIRKQAEAGERVLGRVARLSASFDLLEALVGQPEFKNFRLTDPKIYVLREADGRLDWANDGLLSRAVRDARPDSSGQVLTADDDARVGDVRISNGVFEISDVASGRVTRFQSINGTLDWPWLSRGLELKADANLNGQALTLDMSSTQPLLLLSGKSGNLSGTMASALFHGQFRGVANLAAHAFLSGDAELTVPDLSAVMRWSGLNLAGVERLKSFSLNTRLVTNDNILRFDNLSLGLNDIKATGILDLMLPPDRAPRLAGTLAFDRMDLSAALAAIAPRAMGDTSQGNGHLAGLELDLRLSAQQATLGRFQLTEAAVSIMNVGDQSRIDIADSDFETGRLTGRIATVKGGTAGAVALRLAIQDADFGNIVKELGLAGPLPAARGSLDLALDVDRPLEPDAWRNAKGTLRFRAERGSLSGVNLAGVRQLAAQKPYFPLSEAGSGSLEFDHIDISANLADGSADIREGKITGSMETLTLSGVIPYINNSLALSATVAPVAMGANAVPLTVFIGGSWPNPVIWPVSQTPVKPVQ
ncbi:AsmA family protein [Rhizobium sp. CF080]|uniref:AsmA family protein n=1 Tax=Rhizobium sp. (strain CF080) TaxID=1144310 RepID=UPI0003E7F552|nr:AsmA-like C-terminal region-containing protein [Rhizobium sp. CF080]EUC00242.1 AsmA family protein [Rhizobium sp. CF080]